MADGVASRGSSCSRRVSLGAACLCAAVLAACVGQGTPVPPTQAPAIPSPTSAYVGTTRPATLPWIARPPDTATPSPVPSATPTLGPMYHTVVQGDTLESIALAYRVTVVELMAANKLGRPTGIRPGDVVVIPHPGVTPTPAVPSATPFAGS